MENVLIAVGFVLGIAFVADAMHRDIQRQFERRFPSRARAWEELGRRDEKDVA